MSDRQLLAEHATGLGVVGLASMGMNAAPLIPIAILAAWGIDRFKSCSERKQRDTINRVIKQIEKANPDHRAVGPALALLKENRHKVAIPATVLADAEKRGDFPDTLYNTVFAGVDVPKDDGIEALLKMVLTAAWQELRLEDDYHKVFVQESVTALERDVADGFQRIEAQLGSIKDDTATIREDVKDLKALLQNLGGFQNAAANAETLALQDLKTLAAAFGETTIDDRATLIQFLTGKAQEYASYRDTIDALDDRVAAIANLKGAAQHAAETLNFDEVEELLSRVDEVETEIAADTKVARAKNALLRNDPTHAFRLLTAAADSFASIDPLEPVKRSYPHFDLLYQHGLRYAGTALDLARDMAAQRLASVTTEDHPKQWADMQNNLGAALQTLGTRTGDPDTLRRAIAAYNAALEVRTREASEMDWAQTQNNLGIALRNLGASTGDPDTLRRAIDAFEAALEVYTREASEMDWAGTQNNLGIAFQTLGTRTGDRDTLRRAIDAFNVALEVRTREASEMDWAMTHENVALAKIDLAKLADPQEQKALYRDALKSVENALEIYTPDGTGFYHEKASRLRAEIIAALGLDAP